MSTRSGHSSSAAASTDAPPIATPTTRSALAESGTGIPAETISSNSSDRASPAALLPAIPAWEASNAPANSVSDAASVSSDASVPTTVTPAPTTIAIAYARARTDGEPATSPSPSSATGVSVA
jgi:hypothetical protein